MEQITGHVFVLLSSLFSYLVLVSAPSLPAGTHLTSQTHCSLYERSANWMMSWQIPHSRRTGLHSRTLSGKGFGYFCLARS